VVAHISGDLSIARGFRAPRARLQILPIGRWIHTRMGKREPARRPAAIFANHTVPAVAIEGRIDQGVGEIAQQPLIVRHRRGEFLRAHIAALIAANPIMYVVADQQRPHPVKIAIRYTAANEKYRRQARGAPPRRLLSLAVWSRRGWTWIHRRAGRPVEVRIATRGDDDAVAGCGLLRVRTARRSNARCEQRAE